MKQALAVWFVFSVVTTQAAELTGCDTFTILAPGNVEEKVRLTSIDAPERGMAFSKVSKQSLTDMTFGKAVTVVWYKHDLATDIVYWACV